MMYGKELDGNDAAPVDNDRFINSSFYTARFDPLPSGDPRFIHVKLEQPDTPYVSAVSAVPAKSTPAGIAHPQLGLALRAFTEGAIIIDVVVSAGHCQDALLDQSIAEATVEARGCGVFGLLARGGDDHLVDIAVFRQGNVDKCHVHMMVRVVAVTRAGLELLRGRFEPFDLVLLQPVVAAELSLVRTVAVGIEEVDR